MHTTVDSLLDGAVVLEQPAPGNGYRFNVDAVLLATFAMHGRKACGHVVDLGAGVGAVALCAAKLAALESITLVDDDPEVCELARRNAERAGVSARVVECGVASIAEAGLGRADVVLMNPPYTQERAGRASPVQGRDRSRRGAVGPFLEAGARLLKDHASRLYVCYPARSLVQLLQAFEQVGLCARRGAMVYPSEAKPARIVLLEASKEPGEFSLDEPVFG